MAKISWTKSVKITAACLVLSLAVLQPAWAVENNSVEVSEVAASDGAAAGSAGQATNAQSSRYQGGGSDDGVAPA